MRTTDGGRENVLVRGVEPIAFAVHRRVQLVEGRIFTPNLGEVVVGVGVARRYEARARRRDRVRAAALDRGRHLRLRRHVLRQRDLGRRDRRPGRHAAVQGYSGMRVTVAPGADAGALKRRIEDDGRFTLEAKPETDVLRRAGRDAPTRSTSWSSRSPSSWAIGATFGALNTMYAAVRAGRAEIGTLRALGFGRGAILLSFLAESLLLAAGRARRGNRAGAASPCWP